MKIVVNKDKCVGCGTCVATRDDIFSFDQDGYANVYNDEAINDSNIQEILSCCPFGAIEKSCDCKDDCNCDEGDCTCGEECCCKQCHNESE